MTFTNTLAFEKINQQIIIIKLKMDELKEFNASTSSLQDCISECLLTHHTDMFFLFIYRNIIYLEYEKKGKINEANLNDVYNKYKKLCSYILLESCRIETPESSKLTLNEIQLYQSLYQPLVQHATSYSNVISTYVIYRDDVSEIISDELFDQEPIYPKFFQRCMMEGYMIALKRIEDNLDNRKFFNVEIRNTKNSKVMILYPTPYGFCNYLGSFK